LLLEFDIYLFNHSQQRQKSQLPV